MGEDVSGFDPFRRNEKLLFDFRLRPFVELFRFRLVPSPGRSLISTLALLSTRSLGSVSDNSVSETKDTVLDVCCSLPDDLLERNIALRRSLCTFFEHKHRSFIQYSPCVVWPHRSSSLVKYLRSLRMYVRPKGIISRTGVGDERLTLLQFSQTMILANDPPNSTSTKGTILSDSGTIARPLAELTEDERLGCVWTSLLNDMALRDEEISEAVGEGRGDIIGLT